MTINIATLPDDKAQLKQLLVDFQARFDKETGILLDEIRLLHALLYGRKSEKTRLEGGPQPLPLFDMPEPGGEEEKEEAVVVPAHSRKKKGRKPLP